MRYTCRCGKLLCNSINPDIEYKIYSDDEWIDIVSDDSIVKPILIPHPKHAVWVCPNCKRAYVFENGTINVKCVYALKECNVNKVEYVARQSLWERLKMHIKR